MEKIVYFTKFHWKKIALAAVPTIYGIHYMKTEYEITEHMGRICKEVVQTVPKANNVLVILNPVANKKQCEKMFKKYCEPILHLAGYSVEIVKTKHIGHAKSIIESLIKMPDVVIVAGGDGTSSEAVTGLLRRNITSCPVLFLPLGKCNETAKSSIQMSSEGKLKYVESLSTSLLALVHERIQYRNIIKYEVIDNDKKSENTRPIFGLNQFSWGLQREIEVNKDNYWYFGGLRYHAAAFATSFSNKINWNINARLLCTPPCPGCNKCVISNKKSYFPMMFTSILTMQPDVAIIHADNELCNKKEVYQIDAKQINISCNKNSESFFELNTEVIEAFPTRTNFFQTMISKKKLQPSVTLKSRTIELFPVKSELLSYYIDGEEYDARPIKISYLPNALKYFC